MKRPIFAAARIGMFLTGTLFIVASPARLFEGTWRSQGYGYVFEITAQAMRTFEVTEQTCVASFTAKRVNSVVPGREATFRTSDGDVFFVKSGGSDDRRLLHNDGAASDMRIDRLPRRPAMCDSPANDTPLNNFEVFTRTWAENYMAFDLKQVNWTKLTEDNRPKITDQTTPAQLFDVLKGMVLPLGDAHVFLEAPKLKNQYHGLRPGTARVISDVVGKDHTGDFLNKGVPTLLAITDRGWLHGPLKKFCNSQIQYGHVDDTIGYLRILSFQEYGGDFEKGAKALDAALNAIFSDRSLRALVIDVRINFGGADPYGLAIASRLARNEYVAYNKMARSDALDRNMWTPSDTSIVRPASGPSFHGPVVELIGPLTVSAGETFTQALMGRTPHVTRLGENTQGVFSDVLIRRLPNHWFFGLPNEIYRTPEGTIFDGSGIPPDIEVPVFSTEDIKAGKDPGIVKAIELLRAQL